MDRIVNDPKTDDDNRSATLTNYRHRIEHSLKLQALRWALKTKYNAPEYCEVCDILVPVPESPKLTVLHLSDIHVDYGYKPGSLAECYQPVCFRFGQPLHGQTGAGFWGDYRGCDLPYWTAEAIVQYIATTEKNIDFVYFTGDLPPHNVWNQSRADQIYTINTINQLYENTISGQFYDHTHYDEFNMFYDEIDPTRPVSMAYVTPSLSPRPFSNPSYRIYTMDGNYSGSSYWVLDHRTVIMNLTASNMYNRTIIHEEYYARDAYQMENLFPKDWDNLIERLQNDIDGQLMGTVYKHYTKSYADGSQCDHKCRRGLLCGFKTARSDDPHACDSIPPFIDS
ncbi:unnamed protein product [Rotaria sordida]|uniref:Sphingomyelin phosphodiesterase C-terminal domain-containing protein n=1 Tax=Rotaria sordida TaxID=392033 RepID=A0A814WFE3_9BILA|nr:unnamed protein product [Rotaria sordida]